MSTGIMFLRTRGRPEQRSFGRVVIGALAIYGGCLTVSLLLIVAGIIVLYAVCATGTMNSH